MPSRTHGASIPGAEGVPEATRSGFVRFQQQLAHEALRRGSLGAARIALRVLSPGDFAAEDAATAGLLSTLRSPEASDEEIEDAVGALIALPPRKR